ncbi:Cna protein B-type domain-containing protein [Ligilactobacillus sp. WC1T17]|uniref:Cna protein B-type domain-containing protein n=1 Tax=Ligilactobacillus ruminis TaxID=1623 RepID=A0ABY1A909_9LACO|nr:Cna protein B-type domain-containing protein [Ligilactobacillus ruminis]
MGALSSQPVLSDVHFDLYRLVDGKWIAYAKNLATGSNGRISYRGMFTGRYKLVETKAKEGYDTAKPIYFTLGKKDINDDSSKEATITLTDEDGIAVTKLQNVSVKEAVAKKNKPVTLQVLDYPHAGILPHTGGSGTLIFKVIGTVVILAACIGLEIEIFLRLKHSKEV